NKLVVITMAVLPIVFLVLPIVAVLSLPPTASLGAVNAIVGQSSLFFLLVPLILPTTIAAYTVIGEREQGTLEPVLTTPATDREILVAKALAAILPAIVLAWLLFALFQLIARLGGNRLVIDRISRPEE